MCTPFGVALAGRKSGLAHCQVTLGSGPVTLADLVPFLQSLAYSPRITCACALPVYALLAGHMSGSRMSGLCALPRWAPSVMALDLGLVPCTRLEAPEPIYIYTYIALPSYYM